MLKRSLLLFLMGLILIQVNAAQAKKAGILLSRSLKPYQAALSGFEKGSSFVNVIYNMEGDVDRGRLLIQSLPADVDLLVTIGTEALQVAKNCPLAKPLVYTMVMQEQNLPGKAASGVLIKIDLKKQISLIKSLLPKATRLGVIYNVNSSGTIVNQAREYLPKNGMTLLAVAVEKPEQVPEALNKMTKDYVDVLWSVLDSTVTQPQVVKQMIEHALTETIPFIGLSNLHVELGAFAAFSVDSEAIGLQTAQLANAVMNANRGNSIESPEKIIIYVNVKTQQKLKLELLPPLPNIVLINQ